jgi:virulence factor Mce-like protein
MSQAPASEPDMRSREERFREGLAANRSRINVVVFAVLSAVLVVYVALSYLAPPAGTRALTLEFADATGLSELGDVTMRGVPVGVVRVVELTPRGTAVVTVGLDAGVSVPEGTKAQLTHRSAIGDVTVELAPGRGPALPDGARISMADTSAPPDAVKTIEVLARVLHSVPSEDLSTVISELAAAVRGRGPDLATLSEASADLPERLLEVKEELESLIVNGPKVTSVLAANADTLADDLAQTAALADILRDVRFDLRDLSENGAAFAQVAADLIIKDKANLACLVADLGAVNALMAQPDHLSDLIRAIENNKYFFRDYTQTVLKGNDGMDWFRVQLVFPPGQPPGNPNVPHRPDPGVFGGNACRSIYGPGVGPATQPQPVHLVPGSELHPGT